MSEYSLDVAFNSTTTQLTFGPIYAMGFGFAESRSGIWKEDGEKVEVVPDGATFYFSIFDTAPPSEALLSNITVTFYDPDNPAVIWPYSPLALPGSKVTQHNPVSSSPNSAPTPDVNSAGCNVAKAGAWRLGPFTVMLPDNIPSLTLDCTVQITLLMDPKDPLSTKMFSVDPEVQVEGGG